MRILTSIFNTRRWTFDIKNESRPLLALIRQDQVLYANPYLVLGLPAAGLPTVGRQVLRTVYKSSSQSCHILFLDVGSLFLPFDFVPDILGGFDGHPVSWLHQLHKIASC